LKTGRSLQLIIAGGTSWETYIKILLNLLDYVRNINIMSKISRMSLYTPHKVYLFGRKWELILSIYIGLRIDLDLSYLQEMISVDESKDM